MSITLNPYLNFNGNTREVMDFYSKVLGGELAVSTFAEFGAPVSESYQDKVMHSRIDADGMTLMASDPQEGQVVAPGSNFSLSLSGGPADHERLTAVFAALAEGGEVQMPLAPAPWGASFGLLTDKFGVSWLVNIDDTES